MKGKGMKPRNEEIFCPKCKARGYRIHDYRNPDEVKYQCKICKYEWIQNTLLEFI